MAACGGGSGGGGDDGGNQTPSASFSAIPISGDAPLLVNFDASGSSDTDGSIASYAWDFGDGAIGSGQTTSHSYTIIGSYTVTLTVTDNGGATATATKTITVVDPPNQAPTASFTASPSSGNAPLLVGFDASGSFDTDGSIASYTWVFGDGTTGSGQTTSHTYTTIGTYTVTLTVTDDVGATATATETITTTAPPNQAPTASFMASPSSGTAPLFVGFDASGSSDTDGSIASYAWDFGDGAIGSGQTTSHTYTIIGSYTVTLTVTDNADDTDTATETISVTSAGQPPPNPSTVAPEIDKTVATTMVAATEFLYIGTNPIQTGVAAGTIDPVRVAVLRGKVKERNGNAIPGVSITILNHPEYGQTLSREDDGLSDGGMFDLAVNGGGALTVNYRKDGYLPVQRQTNVPWQDFIWLPDVVMIPVDPVVTTIDLTATDPMQVARGSVVTDADGTRQATLFIPHGTTAEIILPGGGTQAIITLSFRATEYTVGASGPDAMPAELPPTSGYTYAVELSADEALANGIKLNGKDVVFNQPVPFYVDNFLNFPVGGIVPVGYYDNDMAAWIPYDNGLVIEVITITGGLADVDVDGDGEADTGTALSDLAITDAEREQLADLYSPGKSLWRVQLAHLSTWDHNWPYGPPLDATRPPRKTEKTERKLDDHCKDSGSIIECQNQTLGERVPITGTGFTFNYRSDRVPGRLDSNTIEIQLSEASVPAILLGIELEVSVAGQMFKESFPPNPNQIYTFTWDGMDAYGRTLQGVQPVSISIGYVYEAFYYGFSTVAASIVAAFGTPGVAITSNPARDKSTLWQRLTDETDTPGIGLLDARGQGLGGWTLDVHHAYDPAGKTLYLGDGSRRSAGDFRLITTVAGTGTRGFSGDGGPATEAQLDYPNGVAIGPDGSIYIADTVNHSIRRVAPGGIITTVAGDGIYCYSSDPYSNTNLCGDGGPATEAQLNEPEGVAIGPDGSIYIADFLNHRIRRVTPDGIITTVAGDGTSNDPNTNPRGDGGPATDAQLRYPKSVAIGPDGSIYIADWGNIRIRRVGPDGIITTMAGNGTQGFSGDGGPATDAQLYDVNGVAIGPEGSIYIVDARINRRIRRVTPDGIITTVAGTGVSGFSGDGGPATDAQLDSPLHVAVGPDDIIYITSNQRVRRLELGGIINTVAGDGEACFPSIYPCGDGGPATDAQFFTPSGVAIGPDGSIYIADMRTNSIRRVAPPLPGFTATDIAIPSEDGSELYRFDSTGRHLQTINTLTGAMLYNFSYDTDGRITVIVDGDGNTTTINRDASGNPTTIVAYSDQTTDLVVNVGGYLETITNPAGEATTLTYGNEGLLAAFTDARGNASQFTYDALGRLTLTEDAAGGSKAFSRTDNDTGYIVTKTTAMGQVTTYRMEYLPTGEERRVNTFPDGTQSESLANDDGSYEVTWPDGTIMALQQGPDPRWGMFTPLTSSMTTRTPGGLSSTLTTSRSAVLSDPDDPLSLTTLTNNVDINGRTYTTVYDAASRTLTATTPEARQYHMVIDDMGRVTQLQMPGLFAVNDIYDAQGHLTSSAQGTGADERIASFSYNTQGYLERITDPLGRSVVYEYDAASWVSKQTMPDNREVLFGYDANGNQTSIIPPDQSAHLFQQTPVDLTKEYVAPSVGGSTSSTVYDYDLDGRLSLVTLPDGQQLSFNYDSAGRLSTLTTPEGSTTYTYDAETGLLGYVTAPDNGRLTFTYAGSLIESQAWSNNGVTGSVGYSYDNDFRTTSTSVNDGNSIHFSYDDDSFLNQAGALTLTLDPQNGLLTGTALGNVTDAWTYTGFGEVESYTTSHGVNTLYEVHFAYDKLSRITSKTETIGGVTNVYEYRYDSAGRLHYVLINSTMIASYTYSDNGNRLGTIDTFGTYAGSYDAQDRMLSYGENTYNYTDNGELLNRTNASGTTTYSYDALGNLIQVVLPDNTQINYLVDGVNRRIGTKIDGTMVQGFLYLDPLNPIAELDGLGDLVSRFVYASRDNVPDYMIKGGTTYKIISDHQGSVRLVLDEGTGTIVQRIDYDAYGRILQDTNPGFQPFGFAGGIYDSRTGLVRFGARDYDPATGRWTTKDVGLSSVSDFNLYGYGGHDPVNRVDTHGLAPDLNLFPSGDKHHRPASQVVPKSDVYTIVGHGNPQQIGSGLSPADLWRKIKWEDKIRYHRENCKIKLLACNSGRGENSFAQQLADLSRCTVFAPEKYWRWKYRMNKQRTLHEHGVKVKGKRKLQKKFKTFK